MTCKSIIDPGVIFSSICPAIASALLPTSANDSGSISHVTLVCGVCHPLRGFFGLGRCPCPGNELPGYRAGASSRLGLGSIIGLILNVASDLDR